jgi:hypothetical protein
MIFNLIPPTRRMFNNNDTNRKGVLADMHTSAVENKTMGGSTRMVRSRPRHSWLPAHVRIIITSPKYRLDSCTDLIPSPAGRTKTLSNHLSSTIACHLKLKL